jgi:hypothetical protein
VHGLCGLSRFGRQVAMSAAQLHDCIEARAEYLGPNVALIIEVAVVYQLSWSTSLYCVNFKGCTRLINSIGTLPSQRMLMFARPRLDIVEPLHIPVHLVPLSY